MLKKSNDKINVTGEWFYTWTDLNGNFVKEKHEHNFITVAGYEAVAAGIQALSSPYIVIGTGVDPGETITEGYRQVVTNILRLGMVTRFRAQIAAANGNGNWTKSSLYTNATGVAGAGNMFNLLVSPFSKTSNQILTIEIKITVS